MSLFFQSLGRSLLKLALRPGLIVVISLLCWLGLSPSAVAGINDDRYDGNIFVLYAGNGSLVPVKETLAQALAQGRPTMLTFYVDDSQDCKQFAIVVSRLQEFYGRETSFLPISVDALNPETTPTSTDAAYYYHQGVPQTVIFDQTGAVRFDQTGTVSYETLDLVFRDIFDLPAKTTKDFQRRSYNEFNTELAE